MFLFQALKLDSNNEKATYRAGEAYFEQKEFEEARKYFDKVKQLFSSYTGPMSWSYALHHCAPATS